MSLPYAFDGSKSLTAFHAADSRTARNWGSQLKPGYLVFCKMVWGLLDFLANNLSIPKSIHDAGLAGFIGSPVATWNAWTLGYLGCTELVSESWSAYSWQSVYNPTFSQSWGSGTGTYAIASSVSFPNPTADFGIMASGTHRRQYAVPDHSPFTGISITGCPIVFTEATGPGSGKAFHPDTYNLESNVFGYATSDLIVTKPFLVASPFSSEVASGQPVIVGSSLTPPETSATGFISETLSNQMDMSVPMGIAAATLANQNFSGGSDGYYFDEYDFLEGTKGVALPLAHTGALQHDAGIAIPGWSKGIQGPTMIADILGFAGWEIAPQGILPGFPGTVNGRGFQVRCAVDISAIPLDGNGQRSFWIALYQRPHNITWTLDSLSPPYWDLTGAAVNPVLSQAGPVAVATAGPIELSSPTFPAGGFPVVTVAGKSLPVWQYFYLMVAGNNPAAWLAAHPNP